MGFASGAISSMPEVEEKLKNCLGNQYSMTDWKPAFNAIFAAEEDTPAAISAIETLRITAITASTAVPYPAPAAPHEIPQLKHLKTDLMDAVADLKA